MNNFPRFNPNEPALNQLSSTNLNLVSGGQKSNQLQPGVGYRITQTPGGTTMNITKRRKQVAPALPWKVTSNGDDKISVGYGSVLSYEEASLTLREHGYYEGFVAEEHPGITVTGTGSIYGRIQSALASYPYIQYAGTDSAGNTYYVDLFREFPDENEFLSFSFNTTPPTGAGVFYFELAKVELVDSIAVVTRQILTHNPTLASFIEGP